ncbi:MAG: hypothetical protein NVS9B4_28040 [Candidatus Acidiferrum sp.]
MRLRAIRLLVLVSMAMPLLTPRASADTLNSADIFAVLAGSTTTNAGAGILGATVITGSLGVYPGSSCTGFSTCPVTGPGTILGTVHLADGVALQAQRDLTTAYTTLGGLSGTAEPADLTGLTLSPGVYTVPAAPSNLTGTLKLTDGSIGGSSFIFQMTSSLITSPGSKIDVSGLSPTDSIFWVVRSTATLGDNTVFEGNILALTDINFDPGATIGCGRALAQNGQVTFAGQNATSKIQNQVSIGCAGTTGEGGGGFVAGGPDVPPSEVPEPSALLLLCSGVVGLLGSARKRLHR